MDDDQAGNGEGGSKEESGREEHRGGDKTFVTLRDQVRQATPVHPPLNPAADQQRRSAFLRQLLGLFTGQDYGEHEDSSGEQAATTAEALHERGSGEMLGGWRDADSPAVSAPSTSSDMPGHVHGETIQAASPKDSGGLDSPLTWDQPFASSGGGFTMPSELPTALPSGSTRTPEPWLAAAADSPGSSPSPAYEGIAKPRGEGNDSLVSDLDSFNSPNPPIGTVLPSTGSVLEGNASTGSRISSNSPAAAPSALSGDALAAQLARPVTMLPTAFATDQPESPTPDTNTSPPMESTEADGNAAGDDGMSNDTPGKDADSASTETPNPGDPNALGAGLASDGQGSSSSNSLSLDVPDLPQILAAAVQAGTAGFQSVAREVMAPLSTSVEASIAQIKDINSRFDQHQMDELMKASQMRAIYRR